MLTPSEFQKNHFTSWLQQASSVLDSLCNCRSCMQYLVFGSGEEKIILGQHVSYLRRYNKIILRLESLLKRVIFNVEGLEFNSLALGKFFLRC